MCPQCSYIPWYVCKLEMVRKPRDTKDTRSIFNKKLQLALHQRVGIRGGIISKALHATCMLVCASYTLLPWQTGCNSLAGPVRKHVVYEALGA